MGSEKNSSSPSPEGRRSKESFGEGPDLGGIAYGGDLVFVVVVVVAVSTVDVAVAVAGESVANGNIEQSRMERIIRRSGSGLSGPITRRSEIVPSKRTWIVRDTGVESI